MSTPEQSAPELQDVVLAVPSERGGKPKRLKGTAYVLTDNIYIETIEPRGLAWLRSWWESESLVSREITIMREKTQTERRKVIFNGFVSFSYLNPRDAPDRSLRTIERLVSILRINQPFKGTPLVRNWRAMNADANVWYSEE